MKRKKIKKYLSHGGGVNSYAMQLLKLEQGEDFEAVFVNHGTDWPETYKYLDMFQEWLDKRGAKPITVLKPDYQGEWNLYDYFYKHSMVPQRYPRICTYRFKIQPLENYYQTDRIETIGFDINEKHRIDPARKGQEFPLIEHKMSRWDCKKYIERYNLPVPQKSGCYICPQQRKGQWKELRMIHPDLFRKAVDLENRTIEYRKSKGQKPTYLSPRKIPLLSVVEESQLKLFKRDEYPVLIN